MDPVIENQGEEVIIVEIQGEEVIINIKTTIIVETKYTFYPKKN